MNKKVVYTCITGGYDSLIEPTYISDGFDYICFTDNDKLTSNVWDIRPLPKETEGLTQVKKQRYIKLNPHKILSEYDLSVWVDGNVEVKGNLNELLISDDYSIFVPTHPSRKCLYAESKAVLSMRKDKKENVEPQMKKYKEDGFPTNYGLLQSNILIRRHNNKDCIKLMEEWFNEVKNGSHRDQLSFNYVCWKNKNINVFYMDKKICYSKWFNWNGKHTKVKNIMPSQTTAATVSTSVKNAIEKLNEISNNIGLKTNKRIRLSTKDIVIY